MSAARNARRLAARSLPPGHYATRREAETANPQARVFVRSAQGTYTVQTFDGLAALAQATIERDVERHGRCPCGCRAANACDGCWRENFRWGNPSDSRFDETE